MADCEGHAYSFGWDATCGAKSQSCDGCNECVAKKTVQCPAHWMSFGGSCYLINQDTQDYYGARDWCAKRNATLVSINNADENEFIWKICHSEPDPLTYPRALTRSTCWLGMREKTGTGMRDTPQDRQKWEWLDGSTPDWGPKSNKYRNWALRPGMGDGKGDGNKYYEPQQ